MQICTILRFYLGNWIAEDSRLCVIPEENLETAVREADYIIENVAEKVEKLLY